MNLRLTYAGGVYDRTRALFDGTVRPAGVELEFLKLPVEEVFLRMARDLAFDTSEMSLASYAIAVDRGEPDLAAIPVFPSRHFRLSCLYVREDSPLSRLDELAGLRVGFPEFQMTAAVWVKGMLQDGFGVPLESVTWVTGRPERIPVQIPARIRVERMDPEGGLAQALLRGEIDCLMSARIPVEYRDRQGLRRLLDDSRAVEEDYFRRTGMFPIMHLVAIRGSLVRQHPWLGSSLEAAFAEAKRIAIEELNETTVVSTSLPWLVEELESAQRLLGDDYWPYGLEPNRSNLDTLLRYLFEQGLTKQRLEPERLFASRGRAE